MQICAIVYEIGSKRGFPSTTTTPKPNKTIEIIKKIQNQNSRSTWAWSGMTPVKFKWAI